ncbi:LysR family transcriptional regulator [Acidovorax sp. SUPP2522]|uniref:LysR substrate-binding domain-containing protein n=1 Tax=unclassified Acidovorax TaxID=2684926 RepID=UPI002349A331|nr:MULTISPECIES: LysR substrate-binding domain-containing protein [unclassified Acidovorax]WCM97980.1 LysR substrate-binding domain-containing protein [Acidovorax sp. GBBC 1281]GKT18446.1 LysR family transcriptional regulator [Acidovorax sp. SUPP2522]
MTEPLGRMPSLNALRAFEATSRHLNFRLAGLELGVTQGAVAQQVRALEAELGLKLFERLPRALALTSNGQRYIVGVRRAFELLVQATESLVPQPLRLTVSVTPTFATKWLIPRLDGYTRRHPGVDLRILATERLAHFHNEAVDLAVRYGRLPFGPGLSADLLFEECLVAVCSPRWREPSAQAGRAGDGIAQVLLHDAQSPWETYFEQCAPQARAPAARALHFNQTTLAIDAAAMGQGLALAQQEFVASDLAAGRLVLAFPEALRTGAGYYLVHPRKQRHPESVAQVRRWLLDGAGGPPAAPPSLPG